MLKYLKEYKSEIRWNPTLVSVFEWQQNKKDGQTHGCYVPVS